MTYTTNGRISTTKYVGWQNAYTDYEELAFMGVKRKWVEHLFETVKNVMGPLETFKRHYPEGNPDQAYQDICDLIFYNSVHVLNWWYDTDRRITKKQVQLTVETSHHMIMEVMGPQEVSRSSIGWHLDFPDCYTEWWQEAQ